MSDVPPPQYVAYPRGSNVSSYGSVKKLEILGSAYFGLNTVFFANILLALLVRALMAVQSSAWLVGWVAMAIVIGYLSYAQSMKIAEGKNWPKWGAGLASVLMGLSSVLCCGFIGYVVLQHIAYAEIKRYGVKTGAFGIKKEDLEQTVAKRKQAEAMSPVFGQQPPSTI